LLGIEVAVGAVEIVGTVSKGVAGVRMLVQADTKANRWIIRLVRAGRRRVGYMVGLVAGRRGPAALALLIHRDAEFRNKVARQISLVSPRDRVARRSGWRLCSRKLMQRQRSNNRATDDGRPKRGAARLACRV
jgi:hypothetical protein